VVLKVRLSPGSDRIADHSADPGCTKTRTHLPKADSNLGDASATPNDSAKERLNKGWNWGKEA